MSVERGAAADARTTGTFRAALGAREFRRLLGAYLLSAIGQTFGTVAMSVAVYEQTHAPGWVAAVAGARLAPYVLLPGGAGVIADRTPRRVLLSTSAAIRAVLIAVLGLAVAADASPFAIVVLAFAFTAVGTPCYPALAAAVPTTLRAEDLAAGNALLTSVETLSFVVGPALGGAALVLLSPAAALGVNAAFFLVAFVLALQLAPVPAAALPAERESLFAGIVAGARTIVSSGEVAAPILLVVIVNAVYGGSMVGLVVVAERLLDTGAGGFGLLNAGLGVGACVGVLGTNRVARAQRPLTLLAATTLLAGIPFALLAVVHQPAAAFALMMPAGAGGVLTEIFAITLVQRAVPTPVLARVFSMLDSLLFGAIFLGSAIAPVLIQAMGLRPSLVLVGAVVPLTAVFGARRLHAAAVRAEHVESSLASRTALLGALPWLRGALVPTLEALAAYATREEVAPGTRIIDQWDEPDDFFVVVDGTVEVRRWAGAAHEREEPVTVLGRGAGFGEIGLLQRLPRTASVVARGPVTLLRVDGQLFVAAVNDVSPAGGTSPGGGVLSRLGGGGAEAVDAPPA
jgi:MFS family permease